MDHCSPLQHGAQGIAGSSQDGEDDPEDHYGRTASTFGTSDAAGQGCQWADEAGSAEFPPELRTRRNPQVSTLSISSASGPDDAGF
ncbi:hypothetical protein GCM10017776_30060 [Streptomyces griseoluteus]|nr:hypothetical protein GCM10017776_30060 [Streptomyces griseoluteus]